MESLINPNSQQSHASSLDSLKPSVLVIILILLMTLLISISICFLLRCLNRCSSHNSITTISPSSTSSDSFRFSNHRVSPETEPASSVLDSLPVFKFSDLTRRRSKASSSNDCAVCLSKFESNDQLRLLPLCCHAFHKDCIDVWLVSNQTCPLCRSPLFVSDSDLMKMKSIVVPGGSRENSFRIEIGSISRRSSSTTNTPIVQEPTRSYSIGSFDYIVDDVESEISESNLNRKREEAAAVRETAVAVESSLAAEIGGGSRSWLKEYVDRISSRALSFRGSGRFFTGSSRRSEVDLEANHAGEEISEIFRWLSGV